MERAIGAVVLAAALAAGGSAARAQPFTDYFEVLEPALAARLAGIPEGSVGAERAQARALTKCLRALERTSRSEEQDLALLAFLARTLDRSFPGDPEFGPALDGIQAVFRADAEDERTRLLEYLDVFDQFSSEYDRAVTEYGAVEDALARVDEAETRSEAASLLRAAVRRIPKAWARVLTLRLTLFPVLLGKPGVGDLACVVDGLPFRSHTMVSGVRLSDDALILVGWEFVTPVPGPARAIGMAATGVTGPGSYPIYQFEDGPAGLAELYSNTFFPSLAGGWYTFPAPAPHDGVLNVTVFDLERRLVEATFSFTAYAAPGTPEADSLVVTEGTVRSKLKVVRR